MAEEKNEVVQPLANVEGGAELKALLSQKALTIVVFGASGHLAKTKTYPALFSLYEEGVYPEKFNIVGFARSNINLEEFRKRISIKVHGDNAQSFLKHCTYFQGKGYDDAESHEQLGVVLTKLEKLIAPQGKANRLFYLATPPGVFSPISAGINRFLRTDNGENPLGWSRVIIEKPFGKDLDSYHVLAKSIAKHLPETIIYRIDHYLAKEMVQNILTFRFSNIIWDMLWDRKSIRCVKIIMKEKDGVEGRGGYYDEYGVVRDVFQNHLMQVLTLIAMESPVSLNTEDVRDEKVKVLKAIETPAMDKCVFGQYGASADGKQVGYRDDPSVKKINPQSNQLTFFQTVLYVKNRRWSGVPFICKCGKGLDARKTEIRIQFKSDGLHLFPNAAFNELVIRLQPNEAIWFKINTKKPGFARFDVSKPYELDLTYKERFGNVKLPPAYSRLILDSMKGDQSLFVRHDELAESWRIVSPVLAQMEESKLQPQPYPRGSRGPPQADMIAIDHGFQRVKGYSYL